MPINAGGASDSETSRRFTLNRQKDQKPAEVVLQAFRIGNWDPADPRGVRDQPE